MSAHLTIITGASSGIGAAMAVQAEAAGHTVATVSRRPGPGTHLAADLADPSAWAVVADWVDGLVGADDATWSRVALIHNAGTLDPMGFAGEVDSAAYTANVMLNSASAQVLGDRFVAAVRKAGCEAMCIVISSGAGKNPYPGWSSYCAGKAAADMWCRVVGIEQDARSAEGGALVSVLSMAPGVVATDMQANIRNQTEGAFPNVERFREMHAGGALADPAEVGAAIFELSQQRCDGSVYRGATLANGAVLDIRDLS